MSRATSAATSVTADNRGACAVPENARSMLSRTRSALDSLAPQRWNTRLRATCVGRVHGLSSRSGVGLPCWGVARRRRGGRPPWGATVNRVGTDVSVGVAAATEQAAKQAGSLAGTAVSVTGSIVVGGASLVADGAVTLAN